MKFAIAFPVLSLVLVAVIDLGLDHGNGVAVTDAAQRASRAVADGTVGDDATCAVRGPAPDPETRKLVCLAKRRTRMSDDRVAVKILYTGPAPTSISDVTAAKMPDHPDSVIVCISASADSISGLLNPVLGGRFHHARSVSRTAGPATAPFPPPWEENAPTSGGVTDGWAWCTADEPPAST